MKSDSILKALRAFDPLVHRKADGNIAQRYDHDESNTTYHEWNEWALGGVFVRNVDSTTVRNAVINALVAYGRPFHAEDVNFALDLMRASAVNAFDNSPAELPTVTTEGSRMAGLAVRS